MGRVIVFNYQHIYGILIKVGKTGGDHAQLLGDSTNTSFLPLLIAVDNCSLGTLKCQEQAEGSLSTPTLRETYM